ncbi:MAG: metallophosphoesterase [Spirochaetota bacterium]
MYRFLVTASILVLLGFVYLGGRLIPPIWPPAVRGALWLLLALMIANLLWLPFKRWRRSTFHAAHASPGFLTRVLESCAYSFMGFLSLLLAFTALGEAIRVVFALLPQTLQGDLLVQMPAGQNFDSCMALLIITLAVIFFIFGRAQVALGPRYRFVKVVLPLEQRAKRRPRFRRHPEVPKKLRIAQVSDLHIGRAIRKSYVERVVKMINAQQPDIACFTGDIGDGVVTALAQDAAPLAEITTRHGCYFIPGNHEYYWGMRGWLDIFQQNKMTPLINSGTKIETAIGGLFLAGVSDPTAARFAEELPKIPAREVSDLAVLLAHQPLFARSAAAKHYDLMLAGHTHGGQYIPWSWIVHLVFRFAKGLYRTGNLLVYVNDGTGYWGAPLRIGTRPEITILDVYLKELKD